MFISPEAQQSSDIALLWPYRLDGQGLLLKTEPEGCFCNIAAPAASPSAISNQFLLDGDVHTYTVVLGRPQHSVAGRSVGPSESECGAATGSTSKQTRSAVFLALFDRC